MHAGPRDVKDIPAFYTFREITPNLFYESKKLRSKGRQRCTQNCLRTHRRAVQSYLKRSVKTRSPDGSDLRKATIYEQYRRGVFACFEFILVKDLNPFRKCCVRPDKKAGVTLLTKTESGIFFSRKINIRFTGGQKRHAILVCSIQSNESHVPGLPFRFDPRKLPNGGGTRPFGRADFRN